MRPPLWHPPIELSMAERTIIKRIRRAKLFVFLRPWGGSWIACMTRAR